jgi:glycosyltransferase involved in cell wall biosynthesis
MTRRRICFVVSSEMTATAFLLDQIRCAALEYEVVLAVNTARPSFLAERGIAATVVSVPIERKVKPFADLHALLALCRMFRAQRFDIVHSVSPKAGLLAMLGAWITRTPRRVHVFTGQVWATRKGIQRFALKWADRLISALATHVLIDSPSQRDFLVAQGVVPEAKATVLAQGSISGVDVQRFRPDERTRAELRVELGIPLHDTLFLYVGRLNRDKGILDLASAFAELSRQREDVWLALVGPDEHGLRGRIKETCSESRIRFVDYTAQPERYMAAADVLCLPSYREGFGTVIIEAAACGVPAIASRIYGITDAIVDGRTGLLHAAGDRSGLLAQMVRLAADPALRRMMGDAASRRALSDFPMRKLTAALIAFYAKILN